MAVRLKRLVHHESMAVYFLRNAILTPKLVSGENFKLFSSLKIPLGEGLCGWVAQNCKPIVNGNPAVEPGYAADSNLHSALGSALAVPIESQSGVIAVVALYAMPQGYFSATDLSAVEKVVSRMGPILEAAARPSAMGTAAGR